MERGVVRDPTRPHDRHRRVYARQEGCSAELGSDVHLRVRDNYVLESRSRSSTSSSQMR